MTVLTTDAIRLGASATDKHDAIAQAGTLLVTAGCVTPEYLTGMAARETVMSTFIGNGVAIPHGQADDRRYVQRTGISVLQVPGGVTWNEGETAYLIIGIAALADEHIEVIGRLAELLEDEALVMQLARTEDVAAITEALSPQSAH